MAVRKKKVEEFQEKIIVSSLEDLVGDRFGKYAKYIIQERALPDVRDGLKPVQRRILYSMYIDGNTSNKPFRKSAKTVGAVMANFHPHGDSSIYDAMVRMSQDWKMLHPFISMQGNNGSIDNDPPAAMRYTEARLSSLSNELLRDIEKDTVDFTYNFDDTMLEPTVFPSNFPSVLVNGSKGIAAGYSTDIPPHNLKEVTDAVILRIENPYSTVDDIMKVLKGPDFPTGGIVQGKEGVKEAFETGKGKIVIKSKVDIVEERNLTKLVISEIPFEVVKSDIVVAIDEIRKNKKIEGIIEVRDESDRDGLSIVVDLKKEADADLILNYLMKNAKLRVNYNYNMVVIKDKRPCLLGVIDILDAFISHRVEVVERRSRFELNKAENRLHIIEGLIIAINALDEVIKIIRASKDKQDSKKNLIKRFNITEKQAEAIVNLQLYRLSSTDINDLKHEQTELNKLEAHLTKLKNKPSKIRKIVADELREVANKYQLPRKSQLEKEVDEISIDKVDLVVKENVMVAVTMSGYFKRSSMKSYQASGDVEPGYKNGDIVIATGEAYTLDTLLAFTNKGNFLFLPVFELKETKWKDEGIHISNLVNDINSEEKIVSCILVKDFEKDLNVILASKEGFIKRTLLKDFVLTRYNKPSKCMNLKTDDDELIGACLSNGLNNVVLTTQNGYVHLYPEDEISISGLRTYGVTTNKYETLEGKIVSLHVVPQDNKVSLFTVTKNGGTKAVSLNNIKLKRRTNQGTMAMRFFKSDPQELVSSIIFTKDDKEIKLLCSDGEIISFKDDDLKHQPLEKMVRSNPSFKDGQSAILLAFENQKLITTDDVNENENITNKDIKNEVVVNTLDDFNIDDSINLFNFEEDE